MKKLPYKTARVTWLDACNYGDEASIEWFQANAHVVQGARRFVPKAKVEDWQ